MSQSFRFNYIVTIHNKEDLIEQVLMCVLLCCRDNSHIYPVLDGCTDRTEEIVDMITDTFAGVPITKVHTPNVHELLSINAGLRAARHEGDGYNIVLQDDVLLADFMLERKVNALYEWVGPRLGYVSFRLGANFKKEAALSNEAVPYTDYIENAYGHGITEAEVLLPGYLAYRTVPIKSPVCIPFGIIRSVGMLEERLAPYGHDDPEYAIRLIKRGYRNAVFALRIYSDIKWGGTRTTPHPELADIVQRNMNLIRQWHGSDLADICGHTQGTEIFEVPNMIRKEESNKALEVWKETREKLGRYRGALQTQTLMRLKSIVKKALGVAQ